MVARRFCRFPACFVHAQESLRIAKEIEHQQWMAATYCVLGCIFTLMSHFTRPIQLLEAGLSLARAWLVLVDR